MANLAFLPLLEFGSFAPWMHPLFRIISFSYGQ